MDVIVLEKKKTNAIPLDKKNIDAVILEQKNFNMAEKDYTKLNNKPRINDIELNGNKTSQQLKLQSEMKSLTNLEIEKLLGGY